MDRLTLIHKNDSSADGVCHKQKKSICKATLVNKLNFINFSDRTILVNFKHAKYATTLSLQAKPLPCAGERLECVWTVPPEPGTLKAHDFLNLFISSGLTCILVNPKMVIVDEHGISMMLPETCHEISCRKVTRHPCQGIEAQFSQNSAMYSGTLVDISPVSLRTHVTTTSLQSFEWLNYSRPVNLQLHSGQNLIYSGECYHSPPELRPVYGILRADARQYLFSKIQAEEVPQFSTHIDPVTQYSVCSSLDRNNG